MQVSQKINKEADKFLNKLINNTYARPVNYYPKEMLFKENTHPRGIFILEKGNVKLSRKDAAGGEKVIYLAAPREILGLHCVINNHCYESSAYAISHVSGYFLPSRAFLEIVKKDNSYILMVMKKICSRIDAAEGMVAGITSFSSRKRLANALLFLAQKYGMNPDHSLNVSLSLEELAGYTGTSKSYIKKIASDLSVKKIASFSGGKIRIFDIGAVKSILSTI
jgi:CRP-like cAMP-binding protein